MHPIVHKLVGWVDDGIELRINHDIVPHVREPQGILPNPLDSGIVDPLALVDPPNSFFQLCTRSYIELADFSRIADNAAVTVDQPEH